MTKALQAKRKETKSCRSLAQYKKADPSGDSRTGVRHAVLRAQWVSWYILGAVGIEKDIIQESSYLGKFSDNSKDR